MTAIAQVPKDGTEVRVKIGTRWYTAAWVENLETGARYVGARLDSTRNDFTRIPEDAITAVRALRSPARQPVQDTAPVRNPVQPAPPPVAMGAIKTSALIAFCDLANRITAMVRTIRYMSDAEARFLTAGARINWPAAIYTAEDIRAQAENHDNRDSAARPPRHKPTPSDLAQLDEAWAWFSKLDPLDARQRRYLVKAGRLPLSPPQLLIWRHALGASFQTIARDTGEHHETIRRRHIRALERLHAIADAALEQRIAERRSA